MRTGEVEARTPGGRLQDGLRGAVANGGDREVDDEFAGRLEVRFVQSCARKCPSRTPRIPGMTSALRAVVAPQRGRRDAGMVVTHRQRNEQHDRLGSGVVVRGGDCVVTTRTRNGNVAWVAAERSEASSMGSLPGPNGTGTDLVRAADAVPHADAEQTPPRRRGASSVRVYVCAKAWTTRLPTWPAQPAPTPRRASPLLLLLRAWCSPAAGHYRTSWPPGTQGPPAPRPPPRPECRPTVRTAARRRGRRTRGRHRLKMTISRRVAAEASHRCRSRVTGGPSSRRSRD